MCSTRREIVCIKARKKAQKKAKATRPEEAEGDEAGRSSRRALVVCIKVLKL